MDLRWTTPEYSRRRVDLAGDMLAGHVLPTSNDELEEMLNVINNWRSSHSYPLQILKMTLLRRARRVDGSAIIAQRLKRLSSIAMKLRRNKNMKLSQMQDIGGCRAVLRDVKQVDELVDIYEESVAKNPHNRPEQIEDYDYISEPKPDGYRSVHYVYKYRSLSSQHAVFNKLRIEVQLRSQLQHAWATAVETVSTFTGQALKSNIGDADWKRFFALMGSAIALREKRPGVPGTPEDKGALIEELRALTNQLRIEAILGGWSTAVMMTEELPVEAQAYLLVLDSVKKAVTVTPFRKNELARADDEYLRVEKENANNEDVQAVLVSVDSLAALRSAYPNYYLDTSAFLKAVRLAIS